MNLKNILIFSAGLGIGAAGMYFGVKKHYEEICTFEIENMRDSFRKASEDEEARISEELTNDIAEELEEAPEAANKDYGACFVKTDIAIETSSIKKPEVRVEPVREVKDEPYIISPEDFYENQSNDKITLTYFEEDGVFIGVDDEIVPDALELIGGSETLEAVGTYEEDVVYVRNTEMGVDYEVLKDSGSYAVFAGV